MKIDRIQHESGEADFKRYDCEHVCYRLDRCGVVDDQCPQLIVELTGLRCNLDEEKDC